MFMHNPTHTYMNKAIHSKPPAHCLSQYVDHIPRAVKGTVQEILERKDDKKVMDTIADTLDLRNVMTRNIEVSCSPIPYPYHSTPPIAMS